MYKHLVIILSFVALVGCAGGGADIKQDPDLSKDCTILGNCDDVPDTTDTDTDGDVDTDADGGSSGTFRAVKITRGVRDGDTEDLVLYEASELKFRASYGSGSYVWEIANLPEGFTAIDLDKKNAKIEGRAENFDEKTVSVKVCDAEDAANCDARSFKIVVKDNISVKARFKSSGGGLVLGRGIVVKSDLVSETVNIFPPDTADPCSYLRIEVKGHIGGYTLETSDPDVVKFAEMPAGVGACEASYMKRYSPFIPSSTSSAMSIISKTFYLYVDEAAYGTTRRNVTVTVKDSAGNEDKIKFSEIVFEQDRCSIPLQIRQIAEPGYGLRVGLENSYQPHLPTSFKFEVTGGKGPYTWFLNGKKIGDTLPVDFDWLFSNEGDNTKIFNISTSFEKPLVRCEESPPRILDYPTAPCSAERKYLEWAVVEVKDDSCPDSSTPFKNYPFDVTPQRSQDLTNLKMKVYVSGNDTGGSGDYCGGPDPTVAALQVNLYDKNDKKMAYTNWSDSPEDTWKVLSFDNVIIQAGFENIDAAEIKRAILTGRDNEGCLDYFDFEMNWFVAHNNFWYLYSNPYGTRGEDVDVGDNYADLNIFVKTDFDLSPMVDRHVEWKKCSEISSDPNYEFLRDQNVCGVGY